MPKINKADPKRVILDGLKADDQYKKFRKIVTQIAERLDTEKLFNESRSLHAGRTSRELYDKHQFNPRHLIEAALKDLSIRSRLVEMRIQVTIHTSRLKDAIQAVTQYISTEYYNELANYSTVDQRRALVSRATAKAQDLLSEGENSLQVLDTLVKDIDQSGYHLKLMIDALKLLDDSKGKVI